MLFVKLSISSNCKSVPVQVSMFCIAIIELFSPPHDLYSMTLSWTKHLCKSTHNTISCSTTLTFPVGILVGEALEFSNQKEKQLSSPISVDYHSVFSSQLTFVASIILDVKREKIIGNNQHFFLPFTSKPFSLQYVS